ncbi:MAG: hypothetical protein DRJ35_05480 [Thermoprotei archaeon]|nr:MAG: hypothetical protein DRJ35_05480 [Thermoprotei archaeon]
MNVKLTFIRECEDKRMNEAKTLNMMKEVERVAVIGLDALSWSYFNKLFNSGIMPYTKSLIRKAYKFVLDAFPPATPPSWSSIMTGVNPGKHGIHAFVYVDKKTLEQRLYTAYHLKHPRIHEMLSMLNIPSVMLNPVPSYPVIPIRTLKVISHLFFTPKTLHYPDSMKKFARRLPQITLEEVKTLSRDELLNRLTEIVESYLDIVEETADSFAWKLYWLNLDIPDKLLHKCDFSIFEKIIPSENKIFNLIDKMVMKLNQATDVMIIVSDHGFSKYRTAIRLNDILVQKGYAKIHKSSKRRLQEHSELLVKGTKIKTLRGFVKLPLPVLKASTHPLLRPFRKFVKETYRRVTGKQLSVELDVDLDGSDAFYVSGWSNGIYVKKESLIPEIINIFENVKGLKWVKPREEVYEGPYVSGAPHIIVCPDYEHGYLLSSNKVIGRSYSVGTYKDHHPHGVLAVYSPSVHINDKERKIVPNYIVAPLIMYMLGVPLPRLTDATPVLKHLLGSEVRFKFKEYTSKWRILKKLTRIGR